jgi:hypothetical protein
MSISHEAIYTWLYALPKGELAAMEVALRPGRAGRQPRPGPFQRSQDRRDGLDLTAP